MSDRGQATGQTRKAAAAPDRVQHNGRTPGNDLGVPVELPEILPGVTADVACKTRQQQENLDRCAADRELRDELESAGFTGPKYQMFQNELARYGLAVLGAWTYTGYIFKLTAKRGLALYPTGQELEDLHRHRETREELADMTVAEALPRFRDKALAGGGWRADGGASLTTYFLGSCLYVFANEFRKHRWQRERWRRQDCRDPAAGERPSGPATDPGIMVPGNLWVCESLGRADSREAPIVALTIAGWSQEEIAETLGMSPRAVEGVLYRWRKKEKRWLGGGA